MDETKIKLELSRAEVIVFVEFLMRYREKDLLTIEHEAESCLLYDLCAVIESRLPELFDPDWRLIVDRSRTEVVTGPS
jgi:hypothetical protein